MEINHRYAFRADKASEFVEYLKANNISFDDGDICILNTLESSPYFPKISTYAQALGISSQINTVYTKEEFSRAEWFRIWSHRRCGYPQPEGTFVTKNTTYSHTDCPICGSGDTQTAPFRMKKSPNWGKHHFAELNWIGDELFLSPAAKTALESNNITGIAFGDVLDKSGKDILRDVYQLVVKHILPTGISESNTDFAEITVCPNCGQKKYVCRGRGMTAYKKNIFEDAPDVVKTGEVFGSMKYAAREILVRRSVMKAIIANHLERGLVFEPIKLIE